MYVLGSAWMVVNHGAWLYSSAMGSPPSPFTATPSSRESCDSSFLTRAQGQSLVAWKSHDTRSSLQFWVTITHRAMMPTLIVISRNQGSHIQTWGWMACGQ